MTNYYLEYLFPIFKLLFSMTTYFLFVARGILINFYGKSEATCGQKSEIHPFSPIPNIKHWNALVIYCVTVGYL